MISSIKAEFRKLLTVRSTYIVIAFCLGLELLFAFYGEGLKYRGPTDNPLQLQTEVINAINALSLFVALIGVLLMTHEYRYNTIMHTLTASNSRSKTLFAKVFAVSCVVIVLAAVFGTLSPLLASLGLSINGVHLVPQVFYYKDLIWHVLLFSWGYSMAGLLLAVLIRNQIGVIVSLLIIPTIVENILTATILKENGSYLPFMSLSSLINNNPNMSPAKGAAVFMVYMAVGWLVAWGLFLRRDAN